MAVLVCLGCSKNEDEIKPNPDPTTGSDKDKVVIVVKGKKVVIGRDSLEASWATYAKVFNEFKEIEDPETVIQFGHVWSSTNSKPTFFLSEGRNNLNQKIAVSGFESLLTNLKPETKYYVRTYYVTQDGGLEHSPEVVEFTTKKKGKVTLATYPGPTPSFGVEAKDNILVGAGNQIWKFVPKINQWTSLQGVPSAFSGKQVSAVNADSIVIFSTGNEIWEYIIANDKWERTLTLPPLEHKIEGLRFTHITGTTVHGRGYRIPPHNSMYITIYGECIDSVGIFKYDFQTNRFSEEYTQKDCYFGPLASNFFHHKYQSVERTYVMKYFCETTSNALYDYENNAVLVGLQAYIFDFKGMFHQSSLVCLFDKAFIFGGKDYPCSSSAGNNSYESNSGIISHSIFDPTGSWQYEDSINDTNIYIGIYEGRSNIIAVKWKDRIFFGMGNKNADTYKDWWELVP